MSVGPGASAALRAVEVLREVGWKVATAESLTGGLLCSALVDVPGASDVVLGAVVAYDPQVKVEVLGVPADVVRERGTVDPATARLMAEGALARFPGADVAVATTGVAGPDPSEGKPVGTVLVAVADARGTHVTSLSLDGDRRSIREQTVSASLSLLVARVEEEIDAQRR